MSAWKSDFTDAPRDGTQFLVRNHKWQCPAVIHYCMDADGFIFSEDALAEIDGGLVHPIGDDVEWTRIPE